jgi:hypothetical protein
MMTPSPSPVGQDSSLAAPPATHRFWPPAVDVLAWAFVATLILLVRTAPSFVPDIYHDSFQYFSVVENTLNGLLGQTSILHFDAERSFGTIPAPQVTVALGYPLAAAVLNLTGLPIQGAALLVSGISTVGSVLVLGWIAGALNLSRSIVNVVLACFVLNAAVIQFGATALSEALFTFVVLLGLAVLLAAHRRPGSASWLWVAAGLAFGGAYLVRYAGLFFVIGLACLVVRHLISSNRSLARGHAFAFATASVLVLAGMARNVALVGDWRGGNDKVVSNPVGPVLLDLVRGVSGPLLGIGNRPDTLIPRALLVAAFVLAMLWLIAVYVRRRGRDKQDGSRPLNNSVLIDYMLLAAVYVAGMLYTSMVTVVPPNPRYFVVLTPIFLLAVGGALQVLFSSMSRNAGASRTLPAIVLGACFCLYVYLNFTALRLPRIDEELPVANQLNRVSNDGTSAREAVLEHVGPTRTILANNGQAVGYDLDLPTVSLVAPVFSDVEWNEEAIRETLSRFGANVIVVSLPQPGAPDDFLPSPFIRQLALGEAPPWLEPVFRSSDFLIYTSRPAAP